MIPHTSVPRPFGQLFLDFWTTRHSTGSEESKPAGGKVPIRRDMIEHGCTHEVRLYLTCHPPKNRLLLKLSKGVRNASLLEMGYSISPKYGAWFAHVGFDSNPSASQ